MFKLGKVCKISTFPSLSWLTRLLLLRSWSPDSVEVHYPENFLYLHYRNLILDRTSDMELISTTDGVYWLCHSSGTGLLIDQECARQSVPLTLLALCLGCSDVNLAQWLTPLPPSDLCSKVTLSKRPLLSTLNLKWQRPASPPSTLCLPFSTLFFFLCNNLCQMECFEQSISALPLPQTRR